MEKIGWRTNQNLDKFLRVSIQDDWVVDNEHNSLTLKLMFANFKMQNCNTAINSSSFPIDTENTEGPKIWDKTLHGQLIEKQLTVYVEHW